LPNSQNYDYHDKIYKHLPMPLNQKSRHLSLPLKLSSPRVIPLRMFLKKNTMWQNRVVSSPCCSSSNSVKWTRIIEGPTCQSKRQVFLIS
jgi:hypothetical protein